MSTKDIPATVAGPFVMPPEDHLGMSIAEMLRDNFDNSRRLLERCEALAGAENEDAVNAINAASRLLRSNAQMALGAARVARIEIRYRSVSERVRPSEAELNSKKIEDTPFKGERDRLIRELDRNLEVQGLAARVSPDEADQDEEEG